MSIRKPGSPTCWPGFQITPPTKSPTCFHGIGRRTNSSRPPLLPERFAADYRACLGCWPDAYIDLNLIDSPWAYGVMAVTILIDTYLLYLFFTVQNAALMRSQTLWAPQTPSDKS